VARAFTRAAVPQDQLRPVAWRSGPGRGRGNATAPHRQRQCLQTQSAVQAMLFGLIRRVESPGLVLPGVEMVPPGIHRVCGGTRDQEFTRPGCSEGDARAAEQER
jgi:hypothetical protein